MTNGGGARSGPKARSGRDSDTPPAPALAARIMMSSIVDGNRAADISRAASPIIRWTLVAKIVLNASRAVDAAMAGEEQREIVHI